MSRSRVIAIGATVALAAFATHRSDVPVVAGRYSADMTVLLTVLALHTTLLWYRVLRPRTTTPAALASAADVLSAIFVCVAAWAFVDLVSGVNGTPADILALALIAVLVVHLAVAAGRRALRDLAFAMGVACAVVAAAEMVFPVMAQSNAVPETEEAFLSLVAGQWAQRFDHERSGNVVRMLSLSDVFGLESGPDNYIHRVAHSLSEGGIDVEVVNVAVDPSEPVQQLGYMRYGLRYHPQVVVHGFFVGNDFNTSEDRRYEWFDVAAVRRPGDSPWRPRDLLVRQWAVNAVQAFRERRRRRLELDRGIVPHLGRYSLERFLEVQFARLQTWGVKSDGARERLRAVLPLLEQMAAAARAAGAEYVLLIHPDQTQVDSSLQDAIHRRFGTRPDQYDMDAPQRVLREFCRTAHLRCLDMLPILRAYSGGIDLYGVRDTHYSREGNRVTATALRQFLTAERILPPPLSRSASVAH